MMKIFQLKISKLFYEDFLKDVQQYLLNPSPLRGASFGKGSREKEEKNCKLIFTPNPEICLKTLEDTEFLGALQSADYLTSDGLGLYLAYQINDCFSSHLTASKGRGVERKNNENFSQLHFSLWEKIVGGLKRVGAFFLLPYYFFNILFRKKYLYKKYGERICGSDLTSDLVKFSEKNNIKIAIVDPYFPSDAGKCAAQNIFREKLAEKFPHLLFDFYILGKESREDILENIKNSDAKICFATLGMKKQEIFCQEVQKNCPNISLALGVGSSFDYYTGFQQRAPKIFRDIGFEWLYRIFTSPNKLKRLGRIKDALIIFPIKILFYK